MQLAGPKYYCGRLVEKPTIGDDDRPIEPADIRRVNRLLYAGAGLGWLLMAVLPLVIVML